MTFAQSKLFVLKAMAKMGTEAYKVAMCTYYSHVSTPITARTRKLRAVWVLEEDQHIEVGVEPGVEERLIDALAYWDNMTNARVAP